MPLRSRAPWHGICGHLKSAPRAGRSAEPRGLARNASFEDMSSSLIADSLSNSFKGFEKLVVTHGNGRKIEDLGTVGDDVVLPNEAGTVGSDPRPREVHGAHEHHGPHGPLHDGLPGPP